MATTEYHIDPDADTVIILRNACVNFAPWTTAEDETLDVAPSNEEQGPSHSARAQSEEPKITAEEQSTIRYYVSSRHLKLASPWFKRALSDPAFIEANRNKVDGLFHIVAEDWDTGVMLLLMNMLHLQCDEVKKAAASLEMLAKLAVLVDYYECGTSITVWTDKWTGDVTRRHPIPRSYCRDLILWICVAWHFRMEEEFREATLGALETCNEGAIRTCHLPIPGRIVTAIETKRWQAIEAVIVGLEDWLEEFESEKYTCPYSTAWSSSCGSILLGALRRQMRKLGYLIPRPEAPFHGLSVQSICTSVTTMSSPVWQSHNHHEKHKCNFKSNVKPMAKNVERGLCGLTVDEFWGHQKAS